MGYYVCGVVSGEVGEGYVFFVFVFILLFIILFFVGILIVLLPVQLRAAITLFFVLVLFF